MKKLVILALLGILVVGGGAVAAILYFTDELPSFNPFTSDEPAPDTHAYNPAMQPGPSGPSGPEGPPRELPQNLRAPPGIPMVPQPDPRADKMEAVRQDRFESSMDALNRRTEERLRRAGKQPQSAPPRPTGSTPGK